MSARRRRLGIVACALIAFSAAPSLAAAKSGYVVFPGSHEVELRLKGSGGYSIDVSRSGRNFTEAYLNKGPALVVYILRHHHSRGNGIEAKFPGVGRVSVQFHPTGAAQKEPGFFPPCNGGQTVRQAGYFQGLIRLRGERGFTRVHTSRARGKIVSKAKEICKRSLFDPSEPRSEESSTRLFATARSEGRAIAFSATTLGLLTDTLTFFSGAVSEQREGMVIFRQAFVRAPARSFSPEGPGDYPPAATATPPEPFHGSALFQRGHDEENSWTGSLSVVLPGAGRVSMTGPEFSAKLCRDDGCRPSGALALVSSSSAGGHCRLSTRATSSAWLSTTKSASTSASSPGSSCRAR